jgi:hypothetical protein
MESAIRGLTAAVAAMNARPGPAPQPPAIVNVTIPEQAPPVVTIGEGAIQVHIAAPAPPPDQQRMEYDEAGRLVGLVNLHVVPEEESA